MIYFYFIFSFNNVINYNTTLPLKHENKMTNETKRVVNLIKFNHNTM